ncbi:MAG: hypothetical protein ABI818_07170 [Acidobacteriota bacterium]
MHRLSASRIPSGKAAAQIGLLIALLLTVPFAIRVVNAWHHDVPETPSYLPALEGPRARDAFDATPVRDLARMNPGYVIIGDSMAGTRIDPRRLTELAGQPIAPLLHPGSGPAWWYLVLKNWVIASQVRPRCVFIFFRDTNLTNVMFRLDEQFRWMVDFAAHEREDELNSVIATRTEGPWFRLAGTFESIYGAGRARRWIEPALTQAVGRTLIPSRRQHAAFMSSMNARFSLDHLRPMEAADIQSAEEHDADFGRYVNRSLLPLMLRDAKAAGLTLCFVRVQRRPEGGRPPYQSRALRRYVTDLRAYIESHGGILHDDTGDTALTLDMYADGDHLAGTARRLYTEIFFERLKPLFK